MLLDFSVKVVNKTGEFLRIINVSAVDLAMAKNIAAEFIKNNDDEYIDC